ncbi:hypothetical protein DSCA_25140 [Desulfosarcina alkanivorans]|uniref:Uncharacterized protein n=1 Tax=Desulfosarcina alkanivorans TaxID=571177 RepID=A0A5K7YQJ7_9BACT|nr:hypothetical protein DSCA_25140 [Desulfosarcina alkanivorans]
MSDMRIVRDGLLALQERDGTNQLTREYTWGANMGGGIGGLLNMRQGGMDYTYAFTGYSRMNQIQERSGIILRK